MAAYEEGETLVEEREENMVAFLGSKQPIKRKGWFLNPTSNSTQTCPSPPIASFPCKNSNFSKIKFEGWVTKLRNWGQWVEKLKPIYEDSWKKVGIFDAIVASTCRFKRDRSSLFGVVRFWCEETNTFIFPWAEATVTLEDVMILGGFSVLGEPVRDLGPLDDVAEELESEMVREIRSFNRSKSKKAGIWVWVKHYMEEGTGNELEHIALLAMWLSTFVLSAPPARTVGYHVIPVAIRLARGARIALAPAVLASLYRDLTEMKDYLARNRSSESPPLFLWAPFYILQLWIWERFIALRPESSHFVSLDEPRAARWHNVDGKKLEHKFVKSVIKSRDAIQWRPYVVNLDCWCKPSHYRDNGGWACSIEVADEGMISFACCLRECELVGLDCIEQYHPCRVARQFGLDQDVPRSVAHAKSTWDVAWEIYDVSGKNVKFYVPPRLFESDVTLKYSIWWEDVQKQLKKKRERKKMEKRRYLQSQSKKNGQESDSDSLTIFDCLAQKKQRARCKQSRKTTPELSRDITAIQVQHFSINDGEISVELSHSLDQHTCINNTDIFVEPNHSSEPPEMVEQNADALSNPQADNGIVASSLLDVDDEEVLKGIKEPSGGESGYNSVLMEDLEENVTMENVDESSSMKDDRADNFVESDVDLLSSVHVKNEAVITNPLEIDDGVAGDIKDTGGGDSSDDCLLIDHLEETFEVELPQKRSRMKDKSLKDIVTLATDASGNVQEETVTVTYNPSDIGNEEFKGHTKETSVGGSLCDDEFKAQTMETSVGGSLYDDEFKGHTKETSVGGSVCEPILVDNDEETSDVEIVEMNVGVMDRRLEHIGKLKRKIAFIQGRMKELQSQAEVHH